MTDPELNVTTLEYDNFGGAAKSLNRVTKVTYPGNKIEHVEWDPAHPLHVKKSFDIEGKETVYEYDGNGDVTSVTGPDGKTVSYIRGNCCGSVDTLVDAKGQKTHWKHDVLGRTTGKWLKWDLSNPGGSGAVRVQLLPLYHLCSETAGSRKSEQVLDE